MKSIFGKTFIYLFPITNKNFSDSFEIRWIWIGFAEKASIILTSFSQILSILSSTNVLDERTKKNVFLNFLSQIL